VAMRSPKHDNSGYSGYPVTLPSKLLIRWGRVSNRRGNRLEPTGYSVTAVTGYPFESVTTYLLYLYIYIKEVTGNRQKHGRGLFHGIELGRKAK
jgi:hypothetical protein